MDHQAEGKPSFFFDRIRVARPITARDHELYLLALGERAGVPMNCEDFIARR